MKFFKISQFAAASLLLLSACSDFTDVKPKGNNLLGSTSDLEMLLNRDYSYTFSVADLTNIGSNLPSGWEVVPDEIAKPVKTQKSIYFSWDVEGHDKFLAELTPSDNLYTQCYGVIGKVANPILLLVDQADGDDSLKPQLKAEAYVLRAYFHYIMVNKYAKAYNSLTAETDPAIVYMKETQDLLTPGEKLTVKQVYDNILSDIDAALSLNSLPDEGITNMRMCLPAAYAVKAMALMSMQRYDEAEKAADSALAINGKVDDYNNMLASDVDKDNNVIYVLNRPDMTCGEDYFNVYGMLGYNILFPETISRFEEGHIVIHNMCTCDAKGWGTADDQGVPGGLINMDGYSPNPVGLKSTHMYLIKAEVAIRNNHIDDAMESLDRIRVNRINNADYAYKPLKGRVSDKVSAINWLKRTAHGENIFSCHGFIENKRWNETEDFKETFYRTIGDKVYTLNPGSSLWIFPFPQNVAGANPNLTNNY